MELYYVIIAIRNVCPDTDYIIKAVYDNEEQAIKEATEFANQGNKVIVFKSEVNTYSGTLRFRINKALRNARANHDYYRLVKAFGFKSFVIIYMDLDNGCVDFAELTAATAEEALEEFKANYPLQLKPLSVSERVMNLEAV